MAAFLQNVKNIINPSRIDDIKSSIGKHSGLNLGNRFNVIITPPNQTLLNLDIQNIATNVLSGNFKPGQLINDPRDFSILCESCTLPGKQIETIDDANDTNWRVTRKIPYNYSFGEQAVTFSFHMTNDFYLRKIFDRWQNLIVDPNSRLINYESEYCTDTIIQVLNQENLVAYAVRLKNSFPTTVSENELNNGSSDPMKLQVTLSYETYVVERPLTSMLKGVSAQLGSVLKKII